MHVACLFCLYILEQGVFMHNKNMQIFIDCGTIGNETTSPLGSDTSRFVILQVRFPSLQLYSRSKRTVLFNTYLTRITDFTHPKKCHTICCVYHCATTN